jgi:DNA-binding NarL/FixJ family response regulator
VSAATQTRVLVADGRRLFRELLREAIEAADDLVLTGEADTAEDALAKVARRRPDIVVFGVATLSIPAEEFIHRALLACSTAAIMVLASSDEEEELLEALGAGAVGFATFGASVDELLEGIRCAAARQVVLPAHFTRRLVERRMPRPVPDDVPRRERKPELTARELEILQLLSKGLGNADIASCIGVSVNTVKNHLYSIYRKLGVSSRGQAFATAAELGLVV